MRVPALVLIVLASPVPGGADTTSAEGRLMDRLSTIHEQNTGASLERLDCDVPEDRMRPFEFECLARDADGDRFTYVLEVDEGGDVGMRVFQPYAQDPGPDFEAFDRAGRAFAEAFAAADWQGMERLFAPELKAAARPEAMARLRREAGEIRSIEGLRTATPSPEYVRMDYRLETSSGPVLAMVKFIHRNPADPEIWGYLVTPKPGSSLHDRQLRAASLRALSELLGAEVTRIEAPLEKLARKGDWIEGVAVLADGPSIPVAIGQKGTAYDLDPVDYTYSSLDTPRLLREHYASTGEEIIRVDCPSRITPHRERMTCVVVLQGEESREVIVSRQGTEHRLHSG